MDKSSLHVISPAASEHAEPVMDLCSKTFGGYYNFHKDMRTWYLLHSHYDWDASAIGFVDGHLVTHFGVWDYQMRIGKSQVRCGGIGAVATDGEYRKRGLMAQTIPHSIAQMHRRGYDLSILFGVWDFYHRFGYVQAWAETTWMLPLERLPEKLPVVKYASFKAQPREDITQLHNRYTAEMTGAAIRPTFSRQYYLFSKKMEGYLWKDSKGKLAGHVLVLAEGGKLICFEGTGQPDDILAVLQGIARKKTLKELRFDTLPYQSPLAKRLRQLTCRCDKQFVQSGSAMVRLVNLESCLRKMENELTDRLQQSEIADYRGELAVACSEGSTGLKIGGGKVRVADKVAGRNSIRGGFEMAQLLIGTDDPMELCEANKVRLTGDAARLVKVLFPNEYPQLHHADRY